MFADRAKIFIKSGKGGDGHVSFRRELFVPDGGPDGGDGGKGGDIIFQVDKGLNTLTDFRHVRKYVAKDGEQGGKRRCHGANGADLVIKVPEGTVIKDAETGKVITDMSGDNMREVVLKGGRGGQGNMHYATATMQAPKYAQPGKPGQELYVNLELKVIADVGLVGFPNVGKSTLLSHVTNANPKIANYHFTTIHPNLGVVDLGEGQGFVMADIPGLIEGAAEGVGLGHDFLRHIERTKMLIHLVDAAGTEGRDPVEDVLAINKELEAYSDSVKNLPQVIAANKIDAIYTEEGEASPIERLKNTFEPQGIRVFPISAVSGQGLKELLYGKYLVRETKAPDGFELDKGVYSVFIENDETTYNVENKAGVGFINQAMKGNLKIKKTSSDGKVEGFTFRVTGENGYDRSFTTDKNGEIFIEGLRIGEYTVSEVSDNVSAGYVLPDDKKASVKVGSTTVVEMHNVLRDTPKTGDNSKVGLWTALAGLSALGIAGTAFIALRKKKKEDDE